MENKILLICYDSHDIWVWQMTHRLIFRLCSNNLSFKVFKCTSSEKFDNIYIISNSALATIGVIWKASKGRLSHKLNLNQL